MYCHSTATDRKRLVDLMSQAYRIYTREARYTTDMIHQKIVGLFCDGEICEYYNWIKNFEKWCNNKSYTVGAQFGTFTIVVHRKKATQNMPCAGWLFTSVMCILSTVYYFRLRLIIFYCQNYYLHYHQRVNHQLIYVWLISCNKIGR